jgi:hypothetical protein
MFAKNEDFASLAAFAVSLEAFASACCMTSCSSLVTSCITSIKPVDLPSTFLSISTST